MITVREAIRELSVGRGQGVLKCNCKGNCAGRCSCAKAGQVCNSRCHEGNPNPKCNRNKFTVVFMVIVFMKLKFCISTFFLIIENKIYYKTMVILSNVK